MGLVFVVPGASAKSSGLGFRPKNFPLDNLRLASFFGGSLSESVKNYADGGTDLLVVGTPTYSAYSATVKNVTDYFVTSIPESDDMTLVSVRATAQAVNGYDISNSSTITRTGGIYPVGINLRSAQYGADPTHQFYPQSSVGYWSGVSGSAASTQSASALITEPATDTWLAHSTRVNSAGTITHNSLTLGTVQTATIPAGKQRDNGGVLRIGSSGLGDSTRSDYLPLGMAMIWDKCLSDQELVQVYDWIKSYYARRDASIVV